MFRGRANKRASIRIESPLKAAVAGEQPENKTTRRIVEGRKGANGKEGGEKGKEKKKAGWRGRHGSGAKRRKGKNETRG